jgi:hypothetical protein
LRRSNDLDKSYSPVESIFSSGKASKKNRNKFGSTDISYGLKFMPAELIRGNLVFENEINLPNSSVNITCALGYNIMESFVEKNGFDLLSGSSSSYLSPEDAVNNGVYQSGGPFISIGFKAYTNDLWNYNIFYSDGDPFNGLYYFLRYERYNYNYLLAPIIKNYPVNGDRNFKITNNHVNYGLGYSAVTSGNIKTIHDFYIGFGLKLSSYTNYKPQAVFNSNNFTNTIEYSYLGKRTSADLSCTIGYSLGFGF